MSSHVGVAVFNLSHGTIKLFQHPDYLEFRFDLKDFQPYHTYAIHIHEY